MKFVTKVKDQATSAFLSTLMLTGLGLSVPAAAVADEAAAGLQFIIVSDDLRKTTTDTERTDGESPAAADARATERSRSAVLVIASIPD